MVKACIGANGFTPFVAVVAALSGADPGGGGSRGSGPPPPFCQTCLVSSYSLA